MTSTVMVSTVCHKAITMPAWSIRGYTSASSPRPSAKRLLAPRRQRLVFHQPASAYSTTSSGQPSPDVTKRAQEAAELLREIVEIAISTGPSGVSRTFYAAQACSALGTRLLTDPANPPKPEELLRQLFEALGSTYIKLGQFIASSPTLFPDEYVREFQKCFDRAPAIPFSTVREIIASELGRPVEDIFEKVDPVPLASASVAQVHAAVLRGSRKNVVIKVLKPGVTDTLKADLSFIYVASRVLTFLNPDLARLSLVDIVRDIRGSIMEETDFTKEAQNIIAFQAYLDNAEIKNAIAPYVYLGESSKKVMTLERIYGCPLTDLNAIREITGVEDNAEQILITALNTWFGSVLACESFHADVHAGNLFVTKEGRVAFIDFGIVGRISPGVRGAVQVFFQATASRDYTLMAKSLVQMGAAQTDVNTAEFANDLRTIYESLDQLDPDIVVSETGDGDGVAATLAVDQQAVSQLLVDVVQVGEKRGVKFPREFGLLLKQILYFDRYVRVLAPEIEVMSDDRVAFMDTAALQAKRTS